tara:strand:- start:1956 stop:3752 length:1797 start_codon:yes stop_codon:yes gene_type:complete
MIIVGVNFSHDSSIAIIKDNKLIAAIEEEKLSRIKQDKGWPLFAIKRLFSEHSIKKNEVDFVVFDKEVPKNLGKFEILFRFTKKRYFKWMEIFSRIFSYFLNIQRIDEEQNKKLISNLVKSSGFDSAECIFLNHHLAHAASVYYTSPFKCDLVLTADGHGGEDAINYYNFNENKLKCIHSNNYTTSVGAFYSAITEILGFRPNRHEGKITGLAAYGKETELVEKFRNLFRYNNRNQLERFPFDLNTYWNDNKVMYGLSLTKKINLNSSSSNLEKDFAMRYLCLIREIKNNIQNHSSEDIAYACQKISEEVILNDMCKVLEKNEMNNVKIGLAGGVFANVRINQKIYENNKISNIFVQPAMGDSGLALGLALITSFNNNLCSLEAFKFENTYLGPDFSSDLKLFVSKFRDHNIKVNKMINPGKEVANLLADNKIVGLWTGKMEWGPRALGSRSIILNTFDKNVNDSLNQRLNRTEFMPFAPAVLDSYAKKYFPKYDFSVPAADYMTMTYDTNPKYKNILQATVHIDGTARPQIVYEDKSPLYYNIIKEFSKISNCGAIVNTSFNAHEEPILSSPETAINALKNKRVDFLVMDDHLFELK